MSRPPSIPPSKQCEVCGKTYVKNYSQSLRDFRERSRFCSKECLGKWNGTHQAVSTQFRKGNIPWFIKKGLKPPSAGWNKLYTSEERKEKRKQWSRESYQRYIQSHSKEERNAKIREWRAKNPGKVHEYYKRGYERNKARYQKHKFLRRKREKYNGGHFTQAEWIALCERCGWRCLACGEKKPLTADHIKPVKLGGSNSIDNIQPLCLSCNCSKQDSFKDYRRV